MDFMDRFNLMVDGPFHFRFIVQPLMAIALGIVGGVRDARAGRTPYVMSLLRGNRQKAALMEGLKQLTVPLVIALGLDMIVCLVLFGRVYPLSSVVVGIGLVGLPYSIARALTNRVWRTRTRARGATTSSI